ncbi:MAG: N-acetylmuramoyl-L-alanine amidase [Candidatus Omnitrophica bacterium]|nr:N-acetylmuramoyl-L-alanine amidase [Candidatus Omnitrophota bacterium]
MRTATCRLVGCALVLVCGCAAPRPAARPLVYAYPSPSAAVPSPVLSPVRTIVVDAGHGGHDPGTSHHGLREKDLALDLARRLRGELNARVFSAVMTREEDRFIPLSQRATIANRIPADLFLSLHINANRNRHVSGVEVYYPRESVIEETAPFPPGIDSSEVALPSPTIKQILWDLVLARARHDSIQMALHVCRSMRRQLHARCRGVRGARFVVLREARMPAVLVEVGYVSNRQDATRLASAPYRQAIAQAVAEGVIAYIRELGLEHL